MRRNELLDRLGLKNPIILAPMGGGPSTPEMVSAVSNAGGLGSHAAAYISPEQILADGARIRQLTDRPFALNLFAGGYTTTKAVDAAPMLAILAEIHAELGLPQPSVPSMPNNPFPGQLEAVLQVRPAVFSFTFGIPSSDDITRLKAASIFTAGTATTVEEAQLLERAGIDAVIAQGAEAGAHRGTFASPFDSAMVPTMQLVRDCARVVHIPVIASGGIMDGTQISAALHIGASAVQLGTAFLACPESGASAAYKQAVLDAHSDTTTITRAFSGRPARGLTNEFIKRFEQQAETILPYPLQNILTRAMRAESARRGDARYLSLWAGQGVTRARSLPAAELVQRLVEEMNAADAASAA